MTSFGYENPDLEETLNRIADAYQDHMNGKRGFPHEIGLVPAIRRWMWKDLSKRRQRFSVLRILESIWKSGRYIKTFEAYDQARDYVIGMTGNGMKSGISWRHLKYRRFHYKSGGRRGPVTAKQISGGNQNG